MSHWVCPAFCRGLARLENNIFPRLPWSPGSRNEWMLLSKLLPIPVVVPLRGPFLLSPFTISVQQFTMSIFSSLYDNYTLSVTAYQSDFAPLTQPAVRFAYWYPYLRDPPGRLHEYCRTEGWVRYSTSLAHNFCGIICNSFQLCFAQFLILHPTRVSLHVPKLNCLSGLFELIRRRGRFSFLEKIKNPFITIN